MFQAHSYWPTTPLLGTIRYTSRRAVTARIRPQHYAAVTGRNRDLSCQCQCLPPVLPTCWRTATISTQAISPEHSYSPKAESFPTLRRTIEDTDAVQQQSWAACTVPHCIDRAACQTAMSRSTTMLGKRISMLVFVGINHHFLHVPQS